MLLDEAVRSLGVFDFFTVACHIDECRIVWHERVNRCENLVETVAFEGREELELETVSLGELSFLDYVCYSHLWYVSFFFLLYPPVTRLTRWRQFRE